MLPKLAKVALLLVCLLTLVLAFLPTTPRQESTNQEVGAKQPITREPDGVTLFFLHGNHFCPNSRAIRDFIDETLAGLGYTPSCRSIGEEAISLVDGPGTPAFDLVILGMTMPGMGGLETFCRLRRRFPRLPILMASGFSPEGEAREVFDQEGVYFLAKPFQLLQLSETLARILSPKV